MNDEILLLLFWRDSYQQLTKEIPLTQSFDLANQFMVLKLCKK